MFILSTSYIDMSNILVLSLKSALKPKNNYYGDN